MTHDANEVVAIDLTDEEWRLLDCGLNQWGGPARCTDELAVAMGFAGYHDFHCAIEQRLFPRLDAKAGLTRLDWVRTLLAAEIAFASGVFGSGSDWPIIVGRSDEDTIRLLRSIQRKVKRETWRLFETLGTRPPWMDPSGECEPEADASLHRFDDRDPQAALPAASAYPPTVGVYDEQRAHLEAVASWAAKIRDHLGLLPARHGHVHFRPGSRGASMVGLLPERPQRGRSNIRDLAELARDFDAQFAKHCRDIAHGRVTPEKRLQSFLVADAYAHDRRMVALEGAFAGPAERGALTFITDEIVVRPLEPNGRGKLVCDLLALRERDGADIPVLIELKSSRAMTELIRQTTRYVALMVEHQASFERLYAATLGRDVRFAGAPEKWIVWPAPTRGGRRDDALREHAITAIEYTEVGDAYRFECALRA